MAEKTKAELKTQSDTTFYDNNNGEIEPVGHRAFNNNLIDSMATHAQGTKADTAIQSATVGGVAVPKNGTTLVFPQFSTGDNGASTAVQAATVGGANIPKSGTTLVFPAYATAAQGTKADKAIQGATLGGVTVPISGNILQIPASGGASWVKCNILENFTYQQLFYNVISNGLYLSGSVNGAEGFQVLTLTNIPANIYQKVNSIPYYSCSAITDNYRAEVINFKIVLRNNRVELHPNNGQDWGRESTIIFNTLILLNA